MKANKNGGKTVIEKFESITQFMAGLNNRQTCTGFVEHSKRRNIGNTGTFEDATNLLLYGDKDNAELVLKKVIAIKRVINKTTQRQKVGSAVVGFAPNVPNFIAGVPRAMITASPAQRRDKVINLVYNIATPCNVDNNTLQKAVINLSGAVASLEAGGARVNLYVTMCISNGLNEAGVFVRVKSAGQPMDTLKMVYPMGHPSMLRRHFFRWIETSDLPTGFAAGYGSPMGNSSAAALCNKAGVKCDRILSYKLASQTDYKHLAKMIDTGVFV